jgi:hypothetical protein
MKPLGLNDQREWVHRHIAYSTDPIKIYIRHSSKITKYPFTLGVSVTCPPLTRHIIIRNYGLILRSSND